MINRFINYLFLFTLFSSMVSAQSSFESLFQEGIKNYHEKNYAKAKENFVAANGLRPNDSNLITNLGLTEYQLGNTGLAIGLWRKAISQRGENAIAKEALNFVLKKLETKEIPHQIDYWEKFREQILSTLTLEVLLAVTCIFLLSASWLLLKYFGLRKRALEEELPLPRFPLIGTLFSLILVLSLSLTLLKVYDYFSPRATIIPKKVSVLAGPTEKSPPIFELFEGFEVLIIDVDGPWVQVQYPGGMTGWIDEKQLIHTTGKQLW